MLRRTVCLLAAGLMMAALCEVPDVRAAEDEPKGKFLKKLTDEQKAKLKEKLQGLTPEQKAEAIEKFKQRLKDKKGGKKAEPEAKPEPKPEPKPTEKPKPVDLGPPLPPGELAKRIDADISKKLADAKIVPSAKSSDAEFLRRVYLDLAGVIPPADKAATFLDAKDADKRAKLVKELLADPRFGQHLADLWIHLLYPNDSDNRFTDKKPLTEWMAKQFNANAGWDAIARDMVTGTGNVEEHPEATYALANRGVDKMTDSVTRNFLGVQLQCAQCHNHPFTDWKQSEYWGMAQFFMKVSLPRPQAAKDGGAVEVKEMANPNRRLNPLPESAKTVNPKLLGGQEVSIAKADPSRPVLADWMVAKGNPFFAKAMVNRAWYWVMGRGIVNPVDDMLPENEASHPELLNLLAKDFAASGFDLKRLFGEIVATEAYGRTSKPLAGNKADVALYSHRQIKALTPEQLFDSMTSLNGPAGRDEAGRMKGMNKGAGRDPRERFVQFFMPGEGAKPIDYDSGIPQVLRLMNSAKSTSTGGPGIAALARRPTDSAVEILYLTALSRRPTPAEAKDLGEYVSRQATNTQALADVAWALTNSAEFALNK